MKYSQFRRWLENLGIELSKGKGSHWMARLNERQSQKLSATLLMS